MATANRDFKIKNGLIVQGATATVNGNNVITEASSISDISDVDTSGATDLQALVSVAKGYHLRNVMFML